MNTTINTAGVKYASLRLLLLDPPGYTGRNTQKGLNMSFVNGVFLADFLDLLDGGEVSIKVFSESGVVAASLGHDVRRKPEAHNATAHDISFLEMSGDFTDPETLLFPLVKTRGSGKNVTFGRSLRNDICFTSNWISKHHGWFVRDSKSGGWTIVDNHSKNGIWLNGHLVDPQCPHYLSPTDQFQIGDVQLTYFDCEHLNDMIELARMGSAF